MEFLEALAGLGRLILFDKRGTGLSDRSLGDLSIEQRCDDRCTVTRFGGRETRPAWGYRYGCMGLGSSVSQCTSASRVAGLAGPSEVLLTGTVRAVIAGTGIRVEPAGEHMLKGVPDSWRLYRLC